MPGFRVEPACTLANEEHAECAKNARRESRRPGILVAATRTRVGETGAFYRWVSQLRGAICCETQPCKRKALGARVRCPHTGQSRTWP